MATTARLSRLQAGRRVFSRVLVGIDGSQRALEAARQAAILQEPDGRLTLLSAWDLAPPIIGATGARVPSYFDEDIQRGHRARALEAARHQVAGFTAATEKLVRGTAWDQLITEIERDQDTLIAIGASETGRLLGIVEGAAATEIIHKAPCSVLVARLAPAEFPQRLVVGVDGSVESAAAYAAAHFLAARFDADLHAVVAWGGRGVNERLVAAITDGDHDDSRLPPTEALTAAAKDADLLVVGSRGLHGVRALGSVSERVAHTAPCSALVVREPAWQRVAEALGR